MNMCSNSSQSNFIFIFIFHHYNIIHLRSVIMFVNAFEVCLTLYSLSKDTSLLFRLFQFLLTVLKPLCNRKTHTPPDILSSGCIEQLPFHTPSRPRWLLAFIWRPLGPDINVESDVSSLKLLCVFGKTNYKKQQLPAAGRNRVNRSC